MIFPVSRTSNHLRTLGGRFLGLGQDPTALAGKGPRIGLFISGAFLAAVGFLIVLFFGPFAVLAIPVLLFGGFNLLNSRKTSLSLSRSNCLSLAGHLTATFVLYLFLTRILLLTYMTDSIVGSYMGVLKVLSLQNPYGYSIKPFLDQFSFPPSFYTPRIDGSFEFHPHYPALNFLSLLPLYAARLHALLACPMVGGYNRALLSRRRRSSSRRYRAFRDSPGHRIRPSDSILRCTHGASWRGVAVSLFDPFLQVKVLRLDLSNRDHVLLLSILSELHLLLGVPSCF